MALPVCIKRTPFAREAVIKKHQSNGRWIELHTADVVFEDHRVCESQHDKTKKMICAHSEKVISAWASTQSDQSLRCALMG